MNGILPVALVMGGASGALAARLANRRPDEAPPAELRPQQGANVELPGWLWLYPTIGSAGCGILAVRLPAQTAAQAFVLAAWLTLACAGLCLSAVDIATHRLPTPIIAATSAVVSVLVLAAAWTQNSAKLALAALLGALMCGGLYLTIAVASRARIGLGDVRLAAVLGLGLGTAGPGPVILGALAPFVLALPAALALFVRDRDRGSELPFGPFLVAGALLAVTV